MGILADEIAAFEYQVVPDARRKYLSYLSTNELVDCQQRAELMLKAAAGSNRRELWRAIIVDISDELSARQLPLPGLGRRE